ncbi:hypothetical protein ABW19_dt0203490 [Dactylella cylindrospora]|nr:hypothetical protein ABW19_dt0203490 [Dactylella cylindrospora]
MSHIDYLGTIKTLWEVSESFFQRYPWYLAKHNMREFMLQNVTIDGEDIQAYNSCHFWSGFEIARFDIWRMEKYKRYFEWLDRTGGFFYEGWSDATVHSIAVANMLEPRQIHWFGDMGFKYGGFEGCPIGEEEEEDVIKSKYTYF